MIIIPCSWGFPIGSTSTEPPSSFSSAVVGEHRAFSLFLPVKLFWHCCRGDIGQLQSLPPCQKAFLGERIFLQGGSLTTNLFTLFLFFFVSLDLFGLLL